MKTLIACYSFTGNTLKVARELQAKMNADLTRIEAEKEMNYVMKCINALLKKKTPIKPCKTDMKDYDALVVCSPVWAMSAPPAINEYLAELENCDGKKYGVLITFGGNGGDRVETHIKKALLPKKMAFMGSLLIRSKAVSQNIYEREAKYFVANLSK